MIKFDIGSGDRKLNGYYTVDKDLSVSADYCLDIEDDIAFSTLFVDGIDEIRVHHLLEHTKPENKVKIMRLFWDLLKDGGVLDVEVPLFPHPASIQDPTHISFWCRESFWYFIKDNKFGEAFAKRYSDYKVPLFEFIEDWKRGEWAYGIKLRKKI